MEFKSGKFNFMVSSPVSINVIKTDNLHGGLDSCDIWFFCITVACQTSLWVYKVGFHLLF